MKYWKIGDFSQILGKHNNTVDGWFRELETERKLHYVSRVNDEKVYDEQDLRIAEFIVKQRENKWSLNAIFDDIPNHFDLRPFPKEYEKQQKATQIVGFEKMRATLKNEMKEVFNELSAAQMKEQRKELERLLPSREQERMDRINAIMAERKITRILEEEALELWGKKPESERKIKVSWFRKEEDIDKRNHFIKNYIDKYFEEHLKKEFDI